MANRAYFYCTGSPEAPKDAQVEPILAANYQLPILWLSLFSTGDRHSTEVEMMNPADQREMVRVPHLTVEFTAGVNRSKARRDLILRMVPSALRNHFDEWIEFLNSLTGTHIHVDVSEVWCMFESGEFETFLADQTYDADVAKYGLRRYSWGAQVPWQD